MTRPEFEKLITRIENRHFTDKCPDDIRQLYWEKFGNLDEADFEASLDGYFKESTPEFRKEVQKIKREVADLIEKLLASEAGHHVLRTTAGFFGAEIDISEEIIEECKEVFASEKKKSSTDEKTEDNKSFKCPDALTPEILRDLRGGKS